MSSVAQTFIKYTSIPSDLWVNKPFSIHIDVSDVLARTGETGELAVIVNDQVIACEAISDGILVAGFTPDSFEPRTIQIVHNGELLEGFPKQCRVLGVGNISIESAKSARDEPVVASSFTVQIDYPSTPDKEDLNVYVSTPDNRRVKPHGMFFEEAGCCVQFRPDVIGTHKLVVKYRGDHVVASPFYFNVCDPKMVQVELPSVCQVGSNCTISLLTKNAGQGCFEVMIRSGVDLIEHSIQSTCEDEYEISFTPISSILHLIFIRFNGISLDDSPYLLKPIPTNADQGLVISGIPSVCASNESITFTIDLLEGGIAECEITDPNGESVVCDLSRINSNNNSNTTQYSATFVPLVSGKHQIKAYVKGANHDERLTDPAVTNAILQVFDPAKIVVENLPDICRLNQPVNCQIHTGLAGIGNLQICVLYQNQSVPNILNQLRKNVFELVFNPNKLGPYLIYIKMNGFSVRGSPFSVNAVESMVIASGYEYARVGVRCAFNVHPPVAARPETMRIVIRDQNMNGVPCEVNTETNGRLLISFVPQAIGKHSINIMAGNELLSKSPLICTVFDPRKITLHNVPIARVNRLLNFDISTSEAGGGDVSVFITQDDEQLICKLEKIDDYLYRASCCPKYEGKLRVTVKLNGEESMRPMYIPVKGDCDAIVGPIPCGLVGNPVCFTVNSVGDEDGIDSLQVKIIERGSGRLMEKTIRRVEAGNRIVEFIPTSPKIYDIHVLVDDSNVMGSPFKCSVCDVSRVRLSNIHPAVMGQPFAFSVDTIGAGEGHLEVTITDGLQTLPAELHGADKRKFDIQFVPKCPRTHYINVFFNGKVIPGSPFPIEILSPKGSMDGQSDVIECGSMEGFEVRDLIRIILKNIRRPSQLYTDIPTRVVDPEGRRVHHSRSQDEEGRWHIEFIACVAGRYQVQLKGATNDYVSMTTVEVKDNQSKKAIEGPKAVQVNALAEYFIVNPSDSSEIVNIRGHNGEKIEYEHSDIGDLQKISFTPTYPGNYWIRFGAHKYNLTVYTYSPIIFRNAGLLDITRVVMSEALVRSGNVNVIIKDANSHTIPCAFYRGSNNSFTIEYVPNDEGIHEVYVRCQNNLLDLCPIKVDAFDSDFPYDPVVTAQLNETLQQTVYKIADERDLDVKVYDPHEQLVKCGRIVTDKGHVILSLTPLIAGTYHIIGTSDVREVVIPVFAYDDDYVPLSPAQRCSSAEVDTRSHTSKNASSPFTNNDDESHSSRQRSLERVSFDSLRCETVILEVTGLTDPVVNKISSFVVKISEAVDIRITDPAKNEVPVRTEMCGEGVVVHYTATRIGLHRVHILKDGADVQGSPVSVHAYDISQVLLSVVECGSVDERVIVQIDAARAGKGSLKALLKDKHDQPQPFSLQKKRTGTVLVEFTPRTSGEYRLHITFNRQLVPSSPLRLHVRAKSVHLSKRSTSEMEVLGEIKNGRDDRRDFSILTHSPCVIGQTVRLICHTPSAKSAVIKTNNAIVESFAHSEYNGLHVHFRPLIEGLYNITFYDGDGHLLSDKYLKKCTIPAYENQSKFVGLKKTIPIGPVLVYVRSDILNSGNGSSRNPAIDVVVNGADGQHVPIEISKNIDRSIVANFLPWRCQTYKFALFSKGLIIEGSEYEFRVFDPSKVKVIEATSDLRVGRPIATTLYTGKAGDGTISAQTESPSGDSIQPTIFNISCEFHEVVFTPTQTGFHRQKVFLNGIECKNVFRVFEVNAAARDLDDDDDEDDEEDDEDEDNTDVYQSEDETSNSTTFEELPIIVSGKCISNGFLRAHQQTSIQIKTNGSSPFAQTQLQITNADDETADLKIQFDIDKPMIFFQKMALATIHSDITNVIFKALKLPIEDLVNFTMSNIADAPTSTVVRIYLKIDQEIQVETLSARLRSVLSVNPVLLVNNTNLYESANVILDSISVGPNLKQTFQLTNKIADTYTFSFAIAEVGRHLLEVVEGRRKSKIYSFDVYDPQSAFVMDSATLDTNAVTGNALTFKVNCLSIGRIEPKLEILVNGGHASDYGTISKDKSGHFYECSFIVPDVEHCKARVCLNSEDIIGSPLMINTQLPSFSVTGTGIICCVEGGLTEFSVSPCTSPHLLKVKISGPTMTNPKSSVIKSTSDTCVVRYTPTETGVHRCFINYNDKPIRGSPFHVPVVNPKRVKLINDNFTYINGYRFLKFIMNEPNHIEFNTLKAGPGSLLVIIKDAKSTVSHHVQKKSDSITRVTFTPTAFGIHDIYLFWSGFIVSNASLKGFADINIGSSIPFESSRCSLNGISPANPTINNVSSVSVSAIKNAQVQKLVEFSIELPNRLTGNLIKIQIIDPNGNQIAIGVQKTSAGNFRCSFRPELAGTHKLYVRWNNELIPQCPIKFNVINPRSSSPLVIANIDDLLNRDHVASRAITCKIKNVSADSISAVCAGPTGNARIESMVDESGDSCILKITPFEKGPHRLQIWNNNMNADRTYTAGGPLSSLILNVVDGIGGTHDLVTPLPPKVTVWGPGIKDGVINSFNSHFICDTHGAGQGNLTVRIKGPKGGFRVKMQKDAKYPRRILCDYNPKEVGTYVISIKWSEIDIVGSPFKVHIFKNEEDFRKYAVCP